MLSDLAANKENQENRRRGTPRGSEVFFSSPDLGSHLDLVFDPSGFASSFY